MNKSTEWKCFLLTSFYHLQDLIEVKKNSIINLDLRSQFANQFLRCSIQYTKIYKYKYIDKKDQDKIK